MLTNSSMLRLTWAVIEEIPSSDLLSLTDTALVKLILQQLTRKILLTGEEVCVLYGYVGSKTTLIRDIAQSRLVQTTGLANSAEPPHHSRGKYIEPSSEYPRRFGVGLSSSHA